MTTRAMLRIALLFVTGCGTQLPLYVEDNPELVDATEQAVEDLEQYLGAGTFDIRRVPQPAWRMLANPRGGIAVRVVDRISPRDQHAGQSLRTAWQWTVVRIKDPDGILPNVIAHELGHSLALGHSDEPGNLMNTPTPPDWHLTEDQADRMQMALDLL